jgi:hypothetical protein
MRFQISTLKRMISALIIGAVLLIGASAEAFAKQGRHGRNNRVDRGRHLGWTIGRHRGWDRRDRNRDRRDARRVLRRHQREERRDLRDGDFDRSDRRELRRHQRQERRTFRAQNRQGRRLYRNY